MNLAFPALVLFLVILPGFVFCQFFQPNEVRTVDHAPFSAMVLKALLCAAIFNAASATVVYLAGYEIRLGDVVRLLVGGATSLRDLDEWLDWLNLHPVAGVSYFGISNGLALLFALLWRLVVERWKLARKGNPFARLTREFDATTGQYLDRGMRFYPIRGDVFVLRYEETKTLNIRYLSLAPTQFARRETVIECRV